MVIIVGLALLGLLLRPSLFLPALAAVGPVTAAAGGGGAAAGGLGAGLGLGIGGGGKKEKKPKAPPPPYTGPKMFGGPRSTALPQIQSFFDPAFVDMLRGVKTQPFMRPENV